MELVKAARLAKHQLYVWYRSVKRVQECVESPLYAMIARSRGYTYDAEKFIMRGGPTGAQVFTTGSTFPLDHLRFSSSLPSIEAAPIPHRLFLLWPGDNDLTPNRRASIEAIRTIHNEAVEVDLVTPERITQLEVANSPLHPAYRHLSAVHKSDYLRAYLMYHYGGAYLDIKPVHAAATPMIETLERNPSLWAVGAPEAPINIRHLSGGPLARHVRRNVNLTLSQASFAFRPHTQIAAEWLDEVHRRLDYFSSLLEIAPARTPFGDHDNYPVPWFALLSSILAPLSLKYKSHILTEDKFHVFSQSDYSSYR